MTDSFGPTYPLAFRAVLEKAPDRPGVYIVSTPRRWVYVGSSDDIRGSLVAHLNGAVPAPIDQFGPLSFSFQQVPAEDRITRQQALIAALHPVYPA